MSKHFDVIVMGRSIGALSAAALLARRGFTVLVVGHGERPPTYEVEGRTLHRRSFTLLAATSPAFRRILIELAQSQTWKRRVVPCSPMMQVLWPDKRLDVPPDMLLFGREIEREFPELRRLVDELYGELARVNGAADDAFERDAMWPPGTFWERRETNRFAALLPHVRAEPDADLLVEFPRAHPFKNLVATSVAFASDLAQPPPPFAVARLHGAWTRGLLALPNGEQELEDFLIERVHAYGGQCRLDERVVRVEMRRGVAAGVLLDGDEHRIGASFLITDLDGEALASLSSGEGIHKRAQKEWPRITSRLARFVVSVVARKEGIPAPLAPESFLVPNASAKAKATPPIHLQRHAGKPGEELLVAEALVSERSGLSLHQARQTLLDALIGELPFLERHLVVVDSPHDGLPAWVYAGDKRSTIERALLRGASALPEPMVRKVDVDPPGYLGLAGEPIRGPLDRSLLVGRSVLPGLGQEGQLLAAWGAARLITRSDKHKERMRRDMWSKVEFG